jgi:hypothetical protein
MSDEFPTRMGGVMDPEDMQQLGGAASVIMPDFDTNRMYAPSNWTPGATSYTPIRTTTFGDHGAQDLNARLIREQYADYERRFAPIEDMAVGMLTDTGTKDLPLDLARTRETIGGVFGSLQGQQGRAMERFGQMNTAKNITGSNAQAGALVGGLNTATFADEERRMKMLGGGSTSAATVVRGGDNGS